MIIKEKGLLRMMKEAYKRSGYTVAAFEADGDTYLFIHNPGWCVSMELGNVPRKVLGLIAEHIGKLPKIEEGYRVSKEAVQQEIFAVAAAPGMEMMEEASVLLSHEPVRRTRITWDGCDAWQNTVTMEIALVKPDVAGIALFNKEQDIRSVNAHLIVKGKASVAMIANLPIPESEQRFVTHLAGMQWI